MEIYKNHYSYFSLKREKIPFAAILSGFSAIISLLKVYAFSSDNNFSGIVLKNSKYSLTSTQVLILIACKHDKKPDYTRLLTNTFE